MSNRPVAILALALLFVAIATTNAVAERAETTISFLEEIPEGGSLSVENLLGSVTIRGGEEGRAARVDARIVAEANTDVEAQALIDSVRLDTASDGGDFAVQTVFPVERHTAYKLPRSERGGVMSSWVSPIIDRDTVAVEYGGRFVRVGNQRGAAALSVHLTVTLPMDIRTSFRQIVGSIHGSTSRGEMSLEVIEGKILADHLFGSLHARTGGGQVEVTSFYGDELGLQTDSGNLELAEIETKNARLTTGSGKIQISTITVDDLKVESTTGDVAIEKVLPVSLNVSTGSGQIDLTPNFKHTKQASIETISGDVTLRVTELSSFNLQAWTKSGSVKAKGLELIPQQPRQGSIGFRCGAGGPEVEVSAQGGELTVRRM